MSKRKFIVVSNRLPVSVTKQNGKLVYSQSSGGLATAMNSLKVDGSEQIWVGWPGISSDDLTDADKKKITKELKKRSCYPVFLSSEQIDKFYLGYSNTMLWPLFHYFTQNIEHQAELWEAYRSVNELFAEEVLKLAPQNARIWIHDYHLMLLPALIRQKMPESAIGFFLHTPFPSYEIFRLLPERDELLHGLLGADLIGFHTYDYVGHFFRSLLVILGYENSEGSVTIGDRRVQADAFPIGIDYKKFVRKAKRAKIKKTLPFFDKGKKPTKVILSVDRADYSKGILERLEAFEYFLANNPAYRGKVSLIQIVAPTREHIGSYRELREEIEKRTSRINGAYSDVDWTPITYIHQPLPINEVTDLYHSADVMLVTPLRDGMNLVAKEYVASRQDSGVLILSEMAGAASELLEAIQVNPHHTPILSDAIKQALEMPKKEQKHRLERMHDRLKNYSVDKWAQDFIGRLDLAKEADFNKSDYTSGKDINRLAKKYKSSKNRLILLDYDGTLVNFVRPSQFALRPPRNIQRLLSKLTNDDNNTVVIISGRQKSMLSSWFDNEQLSLVAEHGGWVKFAGSWAKKRISFQKWKRKLKPILTSYADKTPGALVEEKEFALVWHYRGVAPDLAYLRKNELKNELSNILTTPSIGVYEGNKILEVKPKAIHKGEAAQQFLDQDDWDFVLVIGDDYTDEDMFAAVNTLDGTHSIKVGHGPTQAKMRLRSVKDAIRLLKTLSDS